MKQLSKLDKPTARRIIDYLRETASGVDPRSRGKGLTGNLAGFWRYRVGNYRIIASIEDDELLILTISTTPHLSLQLQRIAPTAGT